MTEQQKTKGKKETEKAKETAKNKDRNNENLNKNNEKIENPPFSSTLKKSIEQIQTYPKITLLIIYFILIILPLGYNFISGNVLLQGEETYYHLNQAKTITIHNWQYVHLFLFQKYLPLNAIALIPLILGLLTIYCLYLTLEKIQLNQKNTLIFLTLFMISPLFMYAFRTLSSSGLFLCLLSIGFYLLCSQTTSKTTTSKTTSTKILSYLSIIPFVLASSIDGWSTLFLLFLLGVVYVSFRKEISFPAAAFSIIIFCLLFSFTINQYLLSQPQFIGPFTEPNVWNDLIADFGGFQSMSIFMFVLGIIGFILVRKTPFLFYSTLFFLLAASILYTYNTTISLSIGIWFVYLSTIALSYLIERTWTLQKLKHFTILVIILGLLFTTMTYSVRLSSRPPTSADIEVLDWVKGNTPEAQIIFTSPSIGNYVSYYSQHPVVSTLQNSAEIKGNLTQKIYSTAYITELFPLLEGYDISLLYITPEMRKFLPNDQNLLFLLKNERFKLAYSTQDTEMWLFTNISSTKE